MSGRYYCNVQCQYLKPSVSYANAQFDKKKMQLLPIFNKRDCENRRDFPIPPICKINPSQTYIEFIFVPPISKFKERASISIKRRSGRERGHLP